MDYSESDLEKEVRAVIEATVSAGTLAPASWITQSVVSQHPGIEGPDKDFYVLCGYSHTRAAVRKVLQGYRPSDDEAIDPQIIMPGFERLQKVYLVKRDAEQVLVLIHEMTEQELLAKVSEYEQMARGCRKHADELLRYAAIKFGGAAAAE